jgi:DNA invertase Pin-like site-specific DNA recombinase
MPQSARFTSSSHGSWIVASAVRTPLAELAGWKVGFRSYGEPFINATSPHGKHMSDVMATFDEFERALIAECGRAGMAKARREGKRLGRPRKFNGELEALRPAILACIPSRRHAARKLDVTPSTVSRAIVEGAGR